MPRAAFAVVQAAPEVAAELSRIAWAEIATAVAAVVVMLLAIGAAVIGYSTFRSLARTVRTLERLTDRLAPKAEPIVDSAGRIASDASRISEDIRQDLDAVHETVRELNRRARAALEESERRARRFGAVLDAVQTEAEEVLLDTAATARGLHTAAEAFRRPGAAGSVRRRGADEGSSD